MAKETVEKPCFVIGPIAREGTPEWVKATAVLDHIIRPGAKDAGYLAERADDLPRPGTITPEIVRRLLTDDMVIADLTDWNPNVFYELAIRHCSPQKAVILLIEKGQRIPFDVSAERTIFYDTGDWSSPERCRKQFANQIRFAEQNADKLDSPVSTAVDVMAYRESEKPIEQQMGQLMFLMQEIRSEVITLQNQSIRDLRLGEFSYTQGSRIEDRFAGFGTGETFFTPPPLEETWIKPYVTDDEGTPP